MKHSLIAVILIASMHTLSAQSVGIGTPTPHASASLHLESTDQGILIPRLLSAQRDAIPFPAHGLLIYQSDNNPGFYYNKGSQVSPNWEKIGGNMIADFNNGGEAGGADRTLGNTDNYGLGLLTSGMNRLHISYEGDVGIGTQMPQEQLEITGNLRLPQSTDSSGVIKMGTDNFIHAFGDDNTFVGRQAGNLSATGVGNTALGELSLNLLTEGQRNTALGSGALQNILTGDDNVAIGRWALVFGNGSNNTAIGSSALASSLGNDNVAIGKGALEFASSHYNTVVGTFAMSNIGSGTNNTAIGYNTNVTYSALSNSTIIGANAFAGPGAEINSTVIGANAVVDSSNSLILGGTGANAVKVGVGTSAPGEFLDLVDEISGSVSAIRHENSAAASSNNKLRLVHRLNTDLQTRTVFRIESYFSNTTDASRKSRVTFSVANPDLEPVMTFSGQDIGFGTTPALAADLHISRTDGDAILRIEANADDDDPSDQPRIQFYQSGGSETAFIGFNNGDETLRLINQTFNGDLYLGTDGSADMMIDNQTSRVGIGLLSPDAQLHVEGEAGVIPFKVDDDINDLTPFIVHSDGDVGVGITVPQAKMHIVQSSASSQPALRVKGGSTGDTDIFLFEDEAGTERFSLQNDGDLFLNGSQIHSSDIRLKKNIETIPEALQKVTQLRGVNFDWRQDVDGPRSTNRTMGFIAQEVEAVVPHLVQESKSGYKAVAYANITALLVEAVKTQQQEIEELRKMVESLTAQTAQVETLKH